MLRDGDREDSVISGGGHFLGIRRVRKNETPVESPHPTFLPLLLDLSAPVSLHGVLILTFTRERQHTIVECDLYAFRVHARDVRQELESVSILPDVNRGEPLRRSATAVGILQVAEYAVDFILQLRDGNPLECTGDVPMFYWRALPGTLVTRHSEKVQS